MQLKFLWIVSIQHSC